MIDCTSFIRKLFPRKFMYATLFLKLFSVEYPYKKTCGIVVYSISTLNHVMILVLLD